ncbi:uroporphyrinogen-III C-methyltransferase [Alteromonas oceanisediminis]|uniref:uroporphyrinogen-III C-methyltransferase n=1 Tax=Alteromonas oceanisediminis TaxID=2836180 RepID=UPI001BDB5F9C|nr:uroporphyrinogen-III C-methyltransferase [Alteromonas oceanisediminis]MBT0586029.1 uroporphyrinogen-III C-methyltransferase [Alteromonas oceanisediminis]
MTAILTSFFRLSRFLGARSKSQHAPPLKRTLDVVSKAPHGSVLLVGAGPGDPDLLTIKALNAIQQAEVVLVDWLVSQDIVNLIPHTAVQLFVGKRAGKHSISQSSIGALMVTHARDGKRVVRLKGGDPAVFGRTAEEAHALTAANIPFAIIPGITAASGASAYTGIALTHRDCAQSVRFITARAKDARDQPDWVALAEASKRETLVFYMGLSKVKDIAINLMAAGMPGSMPMAVIDQATTSQQAVCVATAGSVGETFSAVHFSGPSLIIIGETVSNRMTISAELLAHA